MEILHQAEVGSRLFGPVIAIDKPVVAPLPLEEIFLHFYVFSVGIIGGKSSRHLLERVAEERETAGKLLAVENLEKLLDIVIDGVSQSVEHIALRAPDAAM